MTQKNNSNRNPANRKTKNKKDIKKRWIEHIKIQLNRIVNWLDKLYWILIWISLCLTVLLGIIFVLILPNDVRKYLIIFYILGLCYMSVLLIISERKKDNKLCTVFVEASWSSYLTFVMVWVPVVCILLYVCSVYIWKLSFNAVFLLQLVYWVIAVAHFIWIIYHIYVRKIEQAKLNLMLKFMVVIISGAGLIMDFIGRIDFTKQFLFIAWSVLVMSYISDKGQNNTSEDKN